MNEMLCRALTRVALSEVDVAARLEVDPKTVRRWMDGRLPYLRHRLALCALLGVSQSDLWPQLCNRGYWPDEVGAVYPHLDAVPSEVWLHMFGSARHEVDVLACAELLAADGLLMNALLASRIPPQARLRICIGEQETSSARAISELRGDQGATCCGEAVLALVSELWPHGSLTVRVCGGVLYNTICRADNELLAAQQAYGMDHRRGSVIVLNDVGTAGMFAAYAGSFERAWASARPLL